MGATAINAAIDYGENYELKRKILADSKYYFSAARRVAAKVSPRRMV